MTLSFAIISIISITCLMILAMFARSKSRSNTQHYSEELSPENHDGDNQRSDDANNIGQNRAR